VADRAGKGSGVEIAEQSACDGVALTSAVFEGGAVEDVDFAALVVDEAASLEGAGAEGDGRAARADHLREELLGEAEVRLPEAVGDHEEPAREPFLDMRMGRVTCSAQARSLSRRLAGRPSRMTFEGGADTMFWLPGQEFARCKDLMRRAARRAALRSQMYDPEKLMNVLYRTWGE